MYPRERRAEGGRVSSIGGGPPIRQCRCRRAAGQSVLEPQDKHSHRLFCRNLLRGQGRDLRIDLRIGRWEGRGAEQIAPRLVDPLPLSTVDSEEVVGVHQPSAITTHPLQRSQPRLLVKGRSQLPLGRWMRSRSTPMLSPTLTSRSRGSKDWKIEGAESAATAHR